MRSAWPTGEPYKQDGAAGDWIRTNWLGAFYFLGPNKIPTYHTGDDLIIKQGNCAFRPVYAIADGMVEYAKLAPGTWGNVVVIAHEEELYSRYAHLARIDVHVGQQVEAGQQVGTIGNANVFAYHLHLDLSQGSLLHRDPTNWPGTDLAFIRLHYLDPLLWIQSHLYEEEKPMPIDEAKLRQLVNTLKDTVTQIDALLPEAPPQVVVKDAKVIADPSVRVRDGASTAANIVGSVIKGGIIRVSEYSPDWVRIEEGAYQGKFVARQWVSFQ